MEENTNAQSVVTTVAIIVAFHKVDSKYDPEGKFVNVQLTDVVPAWRDGKEDTTRFVRVAKTTIINKIKLEMPMLAVYSAKAKAAADTRDEIYDEFAALSMFAIAATVKISSTFVAGTYGEGDDAQQYAGYRHKITIKNLDNSFTTPIILQLMQML